MICSIRLFRKTSQARSSRLLLTALAVLTLNTMGQSMPVQADETRMSPYMAKIVGQEDFVCVWTLGQEGFGGGKERFGACSLYSQVPLAIKLASSLME